MVDGINEPKTYMRKVDGQKQEVTRIGGKFFTRNSNGEMVELEKTRNGSIFGQARFSIKKQDILQTKQKEITIMPKGPEFDNKSEENKWSTNRAADAILDTALKEIEGERSISKEYDSNGNLTKSVDYADSRKEEILITEYNSNNKIAKQTYTDVAGTVLRSISKEYDSNGNLLSEIELNANGGRNSAVFYSNGNPIRSESYNSEGQVEQALTKEYDERGNVVEETNYYMGDATSRQTFEYDENNKCIKRTEYSRHTNSNGEIIEDAELIKTKELELLPNGNTKRSTWQPDGTPISVRELSGNRI